MAIDIFKEYLLPKTKVDYIGGKGKVDVAKLLNGQTLFKLSSNENILGSSPKALQAVFNTVNKLSEYPDRTDERLRNKLSTFYDGELNKNQFFINNGGTSLIDLIERAFLEPRNEIIISNPAFIPYAIFAKKWGAKVIDIPLLGDNFDLNVNGILASINDNTRLIFVTNPNNPMGTHIPKNQLDKLIDNLPEHVILVYDEVYHQYVDASNAVRAYEYVKEGKNVIGVNSFSKAYGLAGLRIGYGYSTEKIARYIAQACTPFMINTLALEAAIAALDDVEFINKTVALNATEKIFIYNELDNLGIQYWKTQANFITIKPEINDEELENAMLMEGIMVRPVASFGAPGCVRVTIGDREANTAYLKALKKIVQ
ncbi:pyridoxal phosphate-dependent aminotransferase [Hyunsoonleella sp. 2307UL5-6]|uniref:pyridoxal phosphate-dependent aminotransferase n=1 Tax=Hyunsoonleella sp. 2307UL5-6 TaxID=3384768 RepID=UPI0039BC5A70